MDSFIVTCGGLISAVIVRNEGVGARWGGRDRYAVRPFVVSERVSPTLSAPKGTEVALTRALSRWERNPANTVA